MIAEDAAGNLSAASSQVSATVTTAPPSGGLVAAYAFDEGAGSTTADRSGNGNNGTLSNATWAGASAGKFGNALSFNGSSSFVTVPDSSSLDLTTGMTLEAWVRPNAGGDCRTVIIKERPSDLVYGLYSSSDTNRPVPGHDLRPGADLDGGTHLAAGTWTHVAATYDGTTQRLYVNGAQVASMAARGHPELQLAAEDRWEHDLAGVVHGADRRGARLQPGAQRSRDPGRHEHEHRARHHAADDRDEGAGAPRGGVNVGTPVSATFSEVVRASTITSSNVVLQGPGGAGVPASVTYDAATSVATLTPQAALQYGTTYRRP